MADFDAFLETLKAGVVDLAGETIEGYVDQALDDVSSFAHGAREDLEEWAAALDRGDLSEVDFKDLMAAQRAVIQMKALTQEGIAIANLQRFREGLMDLVVNTAMKTLI